MKAPEGTITADAARKAARRYADAEGSGWLGFTSKDRSRGEYCGLVDVMFNHVLKIPVEHRKRKYARDLLTEALRAYDLRMTSRYRSQLRRWGLPDKREGQR